jgi:hypothetical protein
MTTSHFRVGGSAPRSPVADSPQSIFGKVMARPQHVGPLIAALLWAMPAGAQQIVVPSGLDIALYDVILEADAQIARFRFVTPAIAPSGDNMGFVDVVGDLQFVCDRVIVPALHKNGWTEAEIVMSVSDQRVDFGTYDPAITQFFQPFRLGDENCIWEDF